MTRTELVIGTRGSKLALWQAGHVKELLKSLHPELEVRLRIIRTTGDKVLDTAIPAIGGQGLFTKELEQALLDHEVDLAVHSLKDLPVAQPDGLEVGVVLRRTYGADVLVSNSYQSLRELPPGARVGTGSLRRMAQLRALRPDLELLDLRGNVDTRLAKLDRGDYDALVLAQAGLVRLGLEKRITEIFPADLLTPAPGQGALALEYRSEDRQTAGLLAPLADQGTTLEVEAERDFLGTLGAGCRVPVGARAVIRENGGLLVHGMLSLADGGSLMRDSLCAMPQDRPGRILAEKMLASGGQKIMDRVLGRT